MTRTDRIREIRETIRALRIELDTLETEERRVFQARDMTEPVRWLGDIGTFCQDLVYHAQRLGRDVRGEFNSVPLVATPKTAAHDLARIYWETR